MLFPAQVFVSCPPMKLLAVGHSLALEDSGLAPVRKQLIEYGGTAKKHVDRPESVRVWRAAAHDYRLLERLPESCARKGMAVAGRPDHHDDYGEDDDAAFVWVKEWFLEQKFLKRIRRVDLDTTLRGAALALIPAPGVHWFWHAGRPFWIYFHRSEESKGWTPKRSEELTFRTIGRRQDFLQQFVDEIVKCHNQKIGARSFLFVYNEYWTVVEAYMPRLLESVILQPGEKEHLVQDVARFKKSKRRYTHLGVPYHRGYLLYGPPGTGKTSLVSALAGEFGMSIYAVNLNDFNDRSLKTAINDVPSNSIILFEDIDCMQSRPARIEVGERKKGQTSKDPNAKEDSLNRLGVTLSGLLNVLDGFYAPENVLFVMTTNRIEVLDEALLRPGRIDYKLFLGKASYRQKIELYRRFFPDTSEFEARAFVETCGSAETMAEFQGLLLGLEQDRADKDTAVPVL
jgi:mitochondrial chaperone BCS1